MRGTIFYDCRICGCDDIAITEVVESVLCPTCKKEIELIQSSKEYLRQFFEENGEG